MMAAMEVSWNAENMTQVLREMFSHYVIELANEAIVVLNPADHVVLANRGIARFGWEPHQLVGRAWSELSVDGADAPLHVLATDVVPSVPTVVVDGDGVFGRADGRDAEVRFVYYRSHANGGHGPTMVVIRDRSH